MTPVSPADRNRVIGLVAAVVIVFGFLAWRVLGAAAPTTEKAPVVHLTTDSAVSQVASTGVITTAQPRVVDVTVPPGAGDIDPFRTVLTDAPKTSDAPPSPAIARTMPPVGMGLTGDLPSVRPMQVNGADIMPKLTGVVTGDDPVAIFGDNTNETIAHVGDRIAGGYLVESIAAESVVLKRDGKRVTLKVNSDK